MKCIDDEIAFEIPAGWEWARGRHIFLPMQSTKPEGEYFTYIDIDAVNNKANIVDKPKILPCSQAPSRATRKLEQNCILFSMVRPYLKNIALIGYEYKDAIASTGFYVIRPCSVLYPQYIFKLLLSAYVVDGLNQYMKGDNSPSINNEHIESYLYPIPPYCEQSRIVEKLDGVLPIVAKYDWSQSELDKLNEQLYEMLKKSILQEAIQGKLVPQDPNDESASVLLERIREEKQRLLKEGKLKKKDITDSVIFKGDDNKYFEKVGKDVVCIEHEIPFDIPDSWMWVRIKDIFQINPKNKASDATIAAFIPMDKISATYGSAYTYDSVKWGNIKSGFTHIADGDVAFAKITPCFQNRKSAIFKGLPNGIGAATTELKVLRQYGETINRWYLLYFLESPYFIDEAEFKGTANQQRIITGYLENKLFPLPPKTEQERIVSVIEQTASIMSR